jgi:hypothetical protein
LLDPRLDDDEEDEQRGGEDQEPDRARGAPAHIGSLRDRVDEQGETARNRQRPADVVAAPRDFDPAFGDEGDGDGEDSDADRDVDEEDPLPAEVLREDSAHEDADRRAASANGSPDAQRLVPLGSFGEEGRDNGESGRRDDGGAEPLHGARRDEDALRIGQAADERGDREERNSDHEDAPAPEQVGRAAREEKEAPEGDRVGADHPLQVLPGEVERLADRRQRDVHDRDVEDRHEEGDADKREGLPPAGVWSRCDDGP